MKSSDVAKVFQDVADLLELKGENPFKIRAYQKAARSIEHLPVEIEQLVAEKRLGEIPGVGEAITKKIDELVATGRLEYYEKLKAEFPEGLSTLLDIPGVGPKTAVLLSGELGVSSADELEAAITGGKVARLYRIGDKTAENILHQIHAMRREDRRIPIGEALPIVDEILLRLKYLPGVRNLSPAGSLRRFRETVGDIDLMATADNAKDVIRSFTLLPQVKEVRASGTARASVIVAGGLQVDLRIVEHDAFGSLLQYFTGSQQHNILLRERARRKGLSLSEYGITNLDTQEMEKFDDEAAFYHRQDLQFIPPELREGQQEIERAEQGTIPELLEIADIKGDLHVHTNWSDGRDSIEDMALAARDRGYQYLAITDHSRGRGIAHGLDADRLEQQIAEIENLNQRISGIRILSGIEVDIRADGILDLPPELLIKLDVVVASVHSAMNQPQEKMTRRILRAIENPLVDVVAHPTCRLLPGREPVSVDMEVILQAAAKNKTALEISAMPSRLDLKDIHIYRARELGVKLVINTDAHSKRHLEFMRFGVGISRRGWCEAHDIMNTRPLDEFLSSLEAW
ncbi:MAG: DNA polymerase/3'-5' exonuclease PolX [Chloroflexi bacterium]|nr:DNA polymerase/3'-5' exonuclease PolX [Chloroflexota bacterium]